MGIKRLQQAFFILALVVFLSCPKMLWAQVPDNVDSSDCSIPPPPKDFDIKLKWRTPHYSGVNDAHSHGRSTPLVGDVDGDGEVEIVVPWSPNTSNNSNDALRPNTFLTRNLNVLNGKTGALKYQIKTCDFSVHGQAIAMADVNGDGKSEIFIVAVGTRASTTKQQYGGKYVYCYDGSKANTTSEDCIWKSADTVYRSYIPLIADINYDGTPELVVGRHIFNAITGRVLLKGTMNATGLGYGGPHNVNGEWQNKKKQELGEQYYMCAVADMDGDGNLEICAGNTIYKLTINSPNSMSNNKFKVLRQCTAALPYNDIYDGQTFVLDFDNDGDLDVCVIGRRTDELPSTTFSNGTNHIGFYVWDGQTPDLIGYFICDPHTFSLSIPFAADIDGDGFPEVIANGWILGHYYNANTNPDMMHVFRYKAGYTSSANNTQARNIEEIFSRTQAGEYCESAGFTVFDFNQDGKSEIVFRGPSSLYILDGSSLTKLCEPMSVASGTTAEYPIVADVDMDGHADIIVTEEYNSSNGSGGCVSVFESKTPNAWGPARKVWNQWPYNVVNINEDMSVPQYLFNITTPFGTGANVRKPFNAFLQQATKLTKDGVMFYPASDANLVQDISAIRSICDSVVMDLCFSNEGSAPLTAPYGLTVYKDEYRGEVLRTRIFPTDLEPKDTMCVHLSFKASEIKELLPIERYVVTINDIGTGIEKEGGQQEECDTTNNKLIRAFEDLKFTAHYDTTVTICSNKMPFYFIDRYLKTGGDYGFALKTSQDCDSIVMLHLRVKDPVHNVETLVACDSCTWHGTKYTASGTYVFDYIDGCPSTDTLHLTVNYGTHNTETEVACDSFSWHGTKYMESGIYTYDYTNDNDCPSTDTLHLTINHATHNVETEVACDSLRWHGKKYTESGVYTYDYTNTDGCPSTDTLYLTVNRATHNVEKETVCESYEWHGTKYIESGTYTYDYTNDNDCPSTDTLHLTVNYGTHNTETEVACDSFSWHGTKYIESGTYTYDYTNDNDCPSTDTLHLTINHATHNVETLVACDSLRWHGKKYTESGTYEYDYTNDAGCPSTDTLHLTVNRATHNVEKETVCESYEWHGEKYTESGAYTYDYTNTDGCPSTDTLHLTVNYGTHNAETEVACDSLRWHGEKYTESGTYEYDYTNDAGCPSTDTLHLTVNRATHNVEKETVCESYEWHGTKYIESGTYTYDYTNDNGCPSTDTLHLTVNYGTHNAETEVACDSFMWHGTKYIESGIYTYDYTNDNDCPSTDTLHLTVNYGTHNTETEVACDSFSWHGTKYIESGTYTYGYTNDNDCPSTDTLHLTINHATHNVEMEVACDSLRWHGEKYTESGAYTYDYTNTDGCPSTDTLHLTVNYGTHNAETEVACDSFMWHGIKYIESGTYEYEYTNADGCPSTDTLHLTINYGTHNAETEVACDSITWHGTKYIESGTYTYDYTNEKDCPSTDTLHLTINHATHNVETEVACDSLRWHGKKYTESGTYEYDYTNDAGCPSTDTLHLTVNYGTHNTETEVACDSFSWHGTKYMESGIYTYDYTNDNDCPSTDTLHLTINYATHNVEMEVACDSLRWHGEKYTESGTYEYDYTNDVGCPSTDTLHLTVNYGTHNAEIEVACDSFMWHGTKYIESGTYEYGYTNDAGCPSTDTLHLTINSTYIKEISDTICDSELPYEMCGERITESGDYEFTVKSVDACDTIIKLHLVINEGSHKIEHETACDSLTWHGTKYTKSGTYTFAYINEAGCPSTDTLHLTVNYGTHNAESEVACDSFMWHGTKYTESGTYEYDYTNADGCPSTDTLHLTINHATHNVEMEVACDSLRWHGKKYTESGTYEYDYTNDAGCPSTDTLHLTVNYATHNVEMEVACDSLRWHGEKYTESGTYEYDYTNDAGCPSTDTLHLTIKRATHNVEKETVCESYEWHGTKYIESGTYTYDYINDNDCPSTDTLHLTVNYGTHNTETEVACDSFMWHGTKYIESGTYTYDYTNDNDCPSTDTLHLTINHATHNAETEVACDSLTWHGSKYTESGVYEYDYTDDDGCPSTDTLHLTINYGTHNAETEVACDSFRWHGTKYIKSGTYTYDYTNDSDCPSTDTLHLTINYGTHNAETEVACDSFFWHGTKYTESGTYEHDYTNADGCPSTDTLHLTIHRATHNAETEVACDSLTWHGSKYTESGVYEYDYTDDDGCPSTDTLHLTINYGTHNRETEVACDSFTWHGTKYIESGTYEYDYTNADGCPSTDTLHLTVNYGTHNAEIEVACDSFTWHGTKYTESGTYEYDYTNADGCPSTDTLHLTINYATHNVEKETVCESYEWHGEKYTESGVYTYDYTNTDGCPSTDTLHLTVNYGTYNAETEVACDSFMWHGTKYIESGTYTYDYTNDKDCPSTDTLHLTINSTYIKEINDTICDSELPYVMCGERITESGDYEFTVKSVDACDTIIKLHLAINEGSHKIEHETACDSLTWHGTKYTESGTYTFAYINEAGCPSTDTLHLTINYGTHNRETEVACDSFTWHGTKYIESGTYEYGYTNDAGCPSMDTLHLTINSTYIKEISDTICDSELPYEMCGERITESGDYEFTVKSVDACDTIIKLHLVINEGSHIIEHETACDSLSWHGMKYTESGTYTFAYTNDAGCPSTDTLYLTVNRATHNVEKETVCESYEWHGNEYTATGVYTYDYTNSDGCPSTDTLHLTVNYGTHNAEIEVACDSFTWHGTKYTESGTYEYDYTDANGCPSTDTLHLTINYTTISDTTVVACENYVWYNERYTESGDYERRWKSPIPEACDRVARLHLTILDGPNLQHTPDTAIFAGTSITLRASGANSLTWLDENGTEIGSGESLSISPETATKYYIQGEDENGCQTLDSIYVSITEFPDNVDSSDCSIDVVQQPWDTHVLFTADNVHTYFVPLVGDIDGDGVVEIVAAKATSTTTNRHFSTQVGIFRGADLRQLATISLTQAQRIYAGFSGPMALVRYPNGSGGMQGAVILHCYDNKLRSYDINGRLLNTSDVNTPCEGAISLADFNQDGYPEVYIGNAVYDAATLKRLCAGPTTGNMGRAWRGDTGDPNRIAMSFAANVMEGPAPELICGNTIYKVNITSRTNTALNSVTELKTIDLPTRIPQDGNVAVADFDMDGWLDVLVIADKTANNTIDSAYFYAYNPTSGRILFTHGQYAKTVSYPMIGDIDGDNNLEFIYIDEQTNVNNSRITAMKYTTSNGLQTMWRATHTDGSGRTSMTLFDFNHDNIMEIVYRDENNLRIINGSGKSHITGNDTITFYDLYTYRMSAGTRNEYPVVADVNDDGSAEIVVCGRVGGGSQAISGQLVVLGGIHTWAPARKVWNQYMYNVTNINEDLTVPKQIFNNSTVFTDPEGVGRRPYNNFLQQATVIDQYGKQIYAVPDAEMVAAELQFDADSITVIFTYCNKGDNMLIAPYPITTFSNGYGSQILKTITATEDLPVDSCMQKRIRLSYKELCELSDLKEVVVTVNCVGRGIAQNGGLQPECDTLNNSAGAPIHLHTDTTRIDTVACEYLIWFEDSLTQSDEYQHILTNKVGCDSVLILHLTINHGTHNVDTLNACDSVRWHDVIYTESGTYTFDYEDDKGCLSTDTLHLTIHHGTHNVDTLIACDSLTWHDVTYKESGTYTFDYENEFGCPSTDTLHLTVFHSSRYDTVVDVCKNELPFVFLGRSLTRSDEYEFHLETAHGCDSLVVLHLTVYLTYNRNKDMTVCENELPILFMDSVITEGGDYVFKKKSLHGCDSMVTLHLTVNENTHNVETEIACDSFTWHGVKYVESGDYTFDYDNETGCPSTDTLHLTINHSMHSAMTTTECDSIIWHGTKYTESGDYVYDYINSAGCPCADTLHLTIHYTEVSDTSVVACDSYLWYDELYTESGDYKKVWKSPIPEACDRIANLHLTIHRSTHNVITETACDSMTWHGVKYTESGDYTYDYENENGCPSTDTLHLTIHHATHNVVTETTCDLMSWHGKLYTESGDYTYDYENDEGCPSVDTLHLTIYQSVKMDTVAVICEDELPYLFMDSLLMEGGEFEFRMQTIYGCDSIVLLHLSVNEVFERDTTVNVCDNWLPYLFSDSLLTEGGDYEFSEKSLYGCDSLVRLHLIVNTSPVISLGEDQQYCSADFVSAQIEAPSGYDSYEWSDGSTGQVITVNAGGRYSVQVTDGNQCTATDTIEIILIENPDVEIQIQSESSCIHESALLTAVSSVQDVAYIWSTGETTQYIEITRHGEYSVLADNQGCLGGDTITIAACDCDIWVPNAFTPNDDALNDRFDPIPSATLGYFHLAIYNRFGELLFQTKDINEGWDGTFKGKLVPLGVYSYVIYYSCKALPEFIKLKKGSVTVVR